jgi:predicted nicotinamide N-methyase
MPQDLSVPPIEIDGNRFTQFVRAHTTPMRSSLAPEMILHLAQQPFEIFQAAETFEGERPYWAFAWSGGQGLARWLLDNPGEVVGKSVIDIGAGSGLSVIAAMQAGARAGTANDTDLLACAAAAINADANGVDLTVTADDLLGTDPDADLILIGDLVYEPELVTRVTGLLERAARRGTAVLFGDRSTARRPPLGFELIAEYQAPLTPDLQIGYVETARVWRLAGTR